MIRKSKKPTMKKLEEIWKKVVKARANYKCEYHKGSCSGSLHAHHISGKRTIEQRTSLNNGICICGYVHNYIAHEDGGCGTRASDFKKWAAKHRGVKVEDLEALGRRLAVIDNFSIEEYLKQQLKKYKELK